MLSQDSAENLTEEEAGRRLLEARKTDPVRAKYYLNVSIGSPARPLTFIERLQMYERARDHNTITPDEPSRHE